MDFALTPRAAVRAMVCACHASAVTDACHALSGARSWDAVFPQQALPPPQRQLLVLVSGSEVAARRAIAAAAKGGYLR